MTSKVELFQGDCAQVMATFDPDCIDLTVTSPPYDNLRTYRGYTFDFEAIAKQLYRVTKPGGVVVWVVGDATVNGSETGTSFRQALYFMGLGFNLHDTMIYNKGRVAYPDQTRYHQVFEYMFVFSNGKPKKVNLIIDRKNRWGKSENWGTKTSRSPEGQIVSSSLANRTVKDIGCRFNVWNIPAGFGNSSNDDLAYQHPAQFPEALARDHILSWSNPGDTVLDPMCGSGTTLKMALTYGRNCIGIDVAQEYLDISRRRVDRVLAQPGLFEA